MTHIKLKTGLLATCLATLLPLATQGAHAATAKAPAQPMSMSSDMPMYGNELMTEKERTTFRARMWAAQTDEERQRIRSEHHEEMKARAQAKGMTLPDMPPMVPGGGMGSGKHHHHHHHGAHPMMGR